MYPQLETLIRLGEFFNVSFDHLLSSDNRKKNPSNSMDQLFVVLDDHAYTVGDILKETQDLTDDQKRIILHTILFGKKSVQIDIFTILHKLLEI